MLLLIFQSAKMVCPRGKTAFMKLLVAMACLASAPVTLAADPACTAADCVSPCLGRVLEDVTSRLTAVEAENAALKEHIDYLRENITSSWSDEVAQAACTALDGNGGWTYAVRRVCGGTGARTCAQICADPALAKADGQVSRLRCINSLHVYASTHPMTRGLTPADKEVLGTKVYRYNSCGGGCGPNFCCCESY